MKMSQATEKIFPKIRSSQVLEHSVSVNFQILLKFNIFSVKIIAKLGEGVFGAVYKVVDHSVSDQIYGKAAAVCGFTQLVYSPRIFF